MSKRRRSNSQNYSREAISVILMGLGFILLLAIISYDRADNPNLEIENNSIQIKNWLGPVGAAIADPLMKFTLGYPVVVVPLIILVVGIQLYRNRKLSEYIRSLILLALWGVVLSILLALPDAFSSNGNIREYFPSGMVGGISAAFLVLYLGKFGSILVVFIAAFSLVIITLRLDLGEVVSSVSRHWQSLQNQISFYFKKWKRENFERKKIKEKRKTEKKREEILSREKEQANLLHSTPPEIKTSIREELAEEKQTTKPEKTDDIPAETIQEKPMLKTTLDELLEESNGTGIDTSFIKKVSDAHEKDESSDQEDLNFEVKEEAKVEEVDYDKLVQESIARYQFPSIDLLESQPVEDTSVTHEELKSKAHLLEAKLLDFGLQAKVIRVTAGPVITLYELQPAPGVKVSQIVALANDLALTMEARGIRMVAPIPGKAAIGIEIPNSNPQIVYLKPILRSEKFVNSKFILPLALGKTINGEVYCADLTKMPHLLIAGSTGSGKSVGINTLIASLVYRVNPGKVKFVMIDPKKIELSIYRPLRDHYLVWRTDLDEEVITKPSNCVSILNSVVMEMESRYDKLAHLGVRSIEEYNERVRLGGPRIKEEKLQQLPYIIVIIDELADLMLIAAKEVETPITRLAQMARAVGIHLILATQRPSVDVITGVIKANFPARIAYMVTTRPDSKTILDTNGAEQLLGNGDMLYQPPGEPRPIRLQNPLITTAEVERIIKHIKKQPKLPMYNLPQPADNRSGTFETFNGSATDSLYEQAKQIVISHQQGSISLLQRRLKIGYSRAARLIDEMEEEGIVGPPDGSKPRQVYYLPEEL